MTINPIDRQIHTMIAKAEAEQEIKEQNIYDGVNINGHFHEFEEKSFFNDQLKMHIPKEFIDLPEEVAKIKYMSGQRPQTIQTDITGSINVTLSMVPDNVDENSATLIKDGIKEMYFDAIFY